MVKYAYVRRNVIITLEGIEPKLAEKYLKAPSVEELYNYEEGESEYLKIRGNFRQLPMVWRLLEVKTSYELQNRYSVSKIHSVTVQ